MDVYTLGASICKRLRDAGFVAYFAGGWTRDHLLGLPSDDIDIATNATAEQVMGLFPKTIPVGLAFQSVVVVLKGHCFEVSSFRKDVGYTDGRHPDQVQLATAQEDAWRRDFTINGMFYDPLEKRLYDFVGGRQDLKAGVIRAIGDAKERFQEDRLRMLRAVRFSVRFCFPMDPSTERAIKEQAHTLLPAVAVERVWQELEKMRAYGSFARALAELCRVNLLDQIVPERDPLSPAQILERLKNMPTSAQTLLWLLALMPELSAEQMASFCGRMKLSRKEERVGCRFLEARALERGLTVPSRANWARFYAQEDACMAMDAFLSLHPEAVFQKREQEEQERRCQLQPHIDRLQKRKPLVDSACLMQLGVKPGPALGALLEQAETLAIDGDLSDAESVIALLKTRHELKAFP